MLGRLLHKYPLWVLLGLLGLTVYAAFLLPHLKIELDFSNYLPADRSELDFYEYYRGIFGSKDDLLTIGIYREEGVFDAGFLDQLSALTDSCRSLPLVEKATSLTSLSLPRKTVFGIIYLPLIHLDKPEFLPSDSAQIVNTSLSENRYISTDCKTVTVILQITPDRDIEISKQFIRKLDELLQSFNFEEVHILGSMDMEVRYAWQSEQETQRFVVICLLMIVLVLWGIYRSIVVVLLSLGCFIISLMLLAGLLVLADFKLDIMAPMIPTIILIVSISDAIHIFSKYQPSLAAPAESIAGINEVLKTNFLTSLTTTIGFFTLLLSPTPVLYYFGLYVGIGVLLAYIVSSLLIPAALFLSRSGPKRPKAYFSEEQWTPKAAFINQVRKTYQKPIVLGCVLLLLLSLWGISRINTNRKITTPMPPRHAIVQSFQFFEKQMSGAREFEIAVLAKEEKGFLNPSLLQEVEKLHLYLDSLPNIGGLVSPVSYFKFLNRFYHLGNADYFNLPASGDQLMKLEQSSPLALKREFSSVIDSSRTNGAIYGRIPDIGKVKAHELMGEIDTWIHANLDTSLFTYQHTGTPVIMDLVNDIQIKAMFEGLLIAIICISLLMAVLFFNWKMVVITLLINLIPLLIVAGSMGFIGIELRGGTSIVFTIAFVIAVDDTIHFLNNVFFNDWQKGDQETAIFQTLKHTGLPIVITSLVIFLAFLMMASSSFGNVKNLGILVSLTVLFALLSDLLLVPMLLSQIKK